MRKERQRKYDCKDSFFNEETEESFYAAGFIAADGCINTKNSLSIRLSTNDKSHLEKLNNLLKSNRPIRDYENEYSGVSVLNITSRQITNDLLKYNITQRKSLIYTFPQWIIDHPLKNHFMRGYFDGDGCFYTQKQSNEKICFGLRGTQSFLKDYRSILEIECDMAHREYDIPMPNKCGMLSYGGNRNIIKISNFLYNDANVFLQRKYDLAMKANELVGNLYAQSN